MKNKILFFAFLSFVAHTLSAQARLTIENNSMRSMTVKVMQGVCRKGHPFEVTNNSSGYSVMTLTFSIKESSVPQATGGNPISKSEFDQN